MLITIAIAASFTGCAPGIIYTEITTPLVLDMDRTPNPDDAVEAELSAKKLQEPISGLGIAVEVDSEAIGDAAKTGGLENAYYADLKTFSILGGLYQKRTVVVTGK